MHIIKILHILFIFFVLFGFLSNDPLMLILYLVTLISLQLHWYLNDDTCFLTIMERTLTGRTNDESFMYQLVSPIYKINDKYLSLISKVVVLILIIFTLIKLWKMHVTPYKLYYIIKDSFNK